MSDTTTSLPVVTEHTVLGRDLKAWSAFDHTTNAPTSIWIDGHWREMFGVWEHLDDIIGELDIPTPNPNERDAWMVELDKLGKGVGKQLLSKMNQIETFWIAVRYVTDPTNSAEVEDAWRFFSVAEPVRVLLRSTVPAPTTV